MRATCQQESLATALDIATRVVASSTQPILGCVRILATEDGRFCVTGSSGEASITHWLPAKVHQAGSIAVPARCIADLVPLLEREDVTLEVSEEQAALHLECARTVSTIKGLPAGEFPVVGSGKRPTRVGSLPQCDLSTALNGAAYAASRDESRPVLTDMLFEASGTTVTLAAADGFRLATYVCTAPAEFKDLRVILPARVVGELARLCGQEGNVDITVDRKKTVVTFDLGDAVVSMKVIEGNYPDLWQVARQAEEQCQTRIVVSTRDLLACLKTALVFARDNARAIRLSVRNGGEDGPGELRLLSSSVEAGDGANVVNATVSGPDAQVALHANFAMDALKAARRPQSEVGIGTPTSPVTFRPVGAENECLAVVMPMQLGTA